MFSSDYVTSVIRTIAASIAGWLVGWLASKGFEIDGSQLAMFISAVATVGYHAIASALQRSKVGAISSNPVVKRLLFSDAQPTYTKEV